MNIPPLNIDALARDFLGLAQFDPVVNLDGKVGHRRRVYLDTTATSLMPRPVWTSLERYLQSSAANSHTHVHRAGRATTETIETARDSVGRLVGYNPEVDQVLFTGHGATGALNFLARVLFPSEIRLWLRGNVAPPTTPALDDRGDRAMGLLTHKLTRPLVVSTVLEHHSNLLPWVEAVGRENLRTVESRPDGTIDLEHLQDILAREGERVSIVSVTGTSNVTGLHCDIHTIARMAHAKGALICVDAAQMAPHHRIEMHPAGDPDSSLDFVAISGHKMYAPGSRGALIGAVAPQVGSRCIGDVGGGMVVAVSLDDFQVHTDITAREEAGTPNIPGTIAMGLASEMLQAVGMDEIAEREQVLTRAFLDRMSAIPDLEIFGPTDMERVPRAGVIAFNIKGINDGLVATYLDHGWNIAVRNGCFCAHPYVKRLLKVDAKAEQQYMDDLNRGDWRTVPGMVRASLGLYSTLEDLDVLESALREMVERKEELIAAYEQQLDGSFLRRELAARQTLELRPFQLRQPTIGSIVF
jgi:selenocysteine lyase/cysteine desulfurase